MIELRTEDAIIDSWQGSVDQPLVSISCIAYNHESYIKDAIIGFLMQETTFPFEVLIHDDASTDKTADIIREYYMRYPRIIKPILQKENQYSQGIKPFVFNHDRAKGEFLAVCEGDDYWTSPDKLARQVAGLQAHPGIDLCFHPAIKKDYARNREIEIGKYATTEKHIIPVEQIIMKTHGLIPTASVMVRVRILNELRKFRDARPYISVGDIYLTFFGAKRGGALFINEVMSVYRAHTPGSWTNKNKGNYKKRMHNVLMRSRSYSELDVLTNHKFSSALKEDTSNRVIGIIKESEIPYIDKLFFFLSSFNYLHLRDLLLALPLVFLPGVTTLISKTRQRKRAA